MPIFFLLTGALIELALLGAGMFPPILFWTAILFCLGCILLLRGEHEHGGLLQTFAVGLAVFLALTALPLPQYLTHAVGRERGRQNGLVEDTLDHAAALGLVEKTTPRFALTRNRGGTLRMMLLLVAGFAAAALSSRMTAEWKERFLRALVVVVAITAIAGYMSQWVVPQGKHIWWLLPVPHGRPVGCFVNRNHFGGFVAMLCPAAAVLFGNSLSRKQPAGAAWWGLISVLMGIAVIMSLSRGAWFAYVVSMAAVGVMAFTQRRALWGAGIFLIALCVAWGITKLPHDRLEERAGSLRNILSAESAQMRLDTWRDSAGILRDYPIVGAGANAFHMVFPQHRTETTRKSFTNAENEYVQIPVEFGLIGSVLVAGLLFCVIWRWHENHLGGGTSRVIELSVLGAVIAVLVHAGLDFALRIPLYLIALSSLIGLVLSPVAKEPAEKKEWRLKPVVVPVAGLVATLILYIPCGWGGSNIYLLDSSDFIQDAGPADLGRALTWSPTSWQVWYHLGGAALVKSGEEAAGFGEACVTVAADYDPNNYPLWEKVARIRLSLGDTEGAQAAYKKLKQLRSWKHIPELDAVEPIP